MQNSDPEKVRKKFDVLVQISRAFRTTNSKASNFLELDVELQSLFRKYKVTELP